MCGNSGIVATRITTDEICGQEHEVRISELGFQLDFATISFRRHSSGMEGSPIIHTFGGAGHSSVTTRRRGRACMLAADIADAGWPEVMKIPTLEEHQAQQAERVEAVS